MTDVLDISKRAQVMHFAQLLNEEKARESELDRNYCISSDVECMINIEDRKVGSEGEVVPSECYYYFVKPEKRVIFWLTEFNAASSMIDICGVSHKTHLSENLELSTIDTNTRLMGNKNTRWNISSGVPIIPIVGLSNIPMSARR